MKFLGESYNESVPPSRRFIAKAPIIGGSRPVSFHPTIYKRTLLIFDDFNQKHTLSCIVTKDLMRTYSRRLSLSFGLIGAAAMLLSAPAHSVLGWRDQQEKVLRLGSSPELILSLKVGWQLGGMALAIFSIVAAYSLLKSYKNGRSFLLPALVIGFGYASYGFWGLRISDFDLSFLIFIIPGLLVALGGLGSAGKR